MKKAGWALADSSFAVTEPEAAGSVQLAPRITGRSGLNFKSAEAASSQGSFHAGFGLMGIPASQAPARNMPYFV